MGHAERTADKPALSSAEAKADVLALFVDQGPRHINCAQAVLAFTLLVRGLDPAAHTVARHLGGGIAGMGEVCGAVSGTALALTMRDYHATVPSAGAQSPPPDAAATRRTLQEFMREFAADFGSLRCRELVGYDLSTSEGHDAFVKGGGNEQCRVFVEWACDRLTQLLDPDAAPAARD
jgi:C_GCAxxG_C_C family probable redox protein